MSGHAVFSPSSSHRWLSCPGSIAACAEKGGPSEESNVYADEGTFAHDIAARALENAIANTGAPWSALEELHDLKGEESDCGRFTADAEMIGYLEDYVEAVLSVESPELWIEKKVYAHEAIYGTADAIVLRDNTLHVFDLKYGAGVLVEAKDNSQARIYALGAVHFLGDKARERVAEVVIHIVQPRHARGGHSTEVLSIEELRAWRDEALLPGYEAARIDTGELEEAERVPGDWCRFCPVKPTCYALRDKSLETAVAVFDDVETLTPAKKKPSPKDLSPTDLGKILKVAPLIEDYLSAVREHAYELANHGVTVPGQKLVAKKSAGRKWDDEDKARAMLEEMLPEGESPFEKPKLLSPAKAEKKLDIIGRQLLSRLCSSAPSSGTVLVDESDKRPAVKPAADVFD